MSALEDLKLEETRDMIGALALLTQNSSGVKTEEFIPNFVGAIEPLRKKGYVIDINEGDDRNHRYALTDASWEYAIKTLDKIGKIL